MRRSDRPRGAMPAEDRDAALLESLAAGLPLPESAPPEFGLLAAALAEAAGTRAEAAEFEASPALAAFRAEATTSATAGFRARRRRGATPAVPPAYRVRRWASRGSVAAIGGVATMVALTAGAYANVLPDPVQRIAHHVLHAPAPVADSPSAPDRSTPGPAPTPPRRTTSEVDDGRNGWASLPHAARAAAHHRERHGPDARRHLSPTAGRRTSPPSATPSPSPAGGRSAPPTTAPPGPSPSRTRGG